MSGLALPSDPRRRDLALSLALLAARTLGAALLLGGVHWLALGYWRRVRSAVTRR